MTVSAAVDEYENASCCFCDPNAALFPLKMCTGWFRDGSVLYPWRPDWERDFSEKHFYFRARKNWGKVCRRLGSSVSPTDDKFEQNSKHKLLYWPVEKLQTCVNDFYLLWKQGFSRSLLNGWSFDLFFFSLKWREKHFCNIATLHNYLFILFIVAFIIASSLVYVIISVHVCIYFPNYVFVDFMF